MLNQIARQSKGAKDRDIPLSTFCLEQLRSYYKTHKQKEYLIEGQNGGQYSASSIKSVLKRTLHECHINKKITVHSLRHAYSTHWLENGTDTSQISDSI